MDVKYIEYVKCYLVGNGVVEADLPGSLGRAAPARAAGTREGACWRREHAVRPLFSA